MIEPNYTRVGVPVPTTFGQLGLTDGQVLAYSVEDSAVLLCQECGALVMNRDRHTEWHQDWACAPRAELTPEGITRAVQAYDRYVHTERGESQP